MEHNILTVRDVSFCLYFSQPDRGRPLPKFGEWDVNNPASAEGFTVIFNKARDEKKTKTAAVVKIATPRKNDVAVKKVHDTSKVHDLLCL